MNIFNNIKSLKDHEQVHRMEVLDNGKLVSIGIHMLNFEGNMVLKSYPVREDKRILYCTSQWTDEGELMYSDSKLSARDVTRLIDQLTEEPVV